MEKVAPQESKIAARLRRLREARHLSNAEIAEQLGMSTAGVKQIMQGLASGRWSSSPIWRAC
jgi:transcriptional regulator with XRE-family HTH domain